MPERDEPKVSSAGPDSAPPAPPAESEKFRGSGRAVEKGYQLVTNDPPPVNQTPPADVGPPVDLPAQAPASDD